MPERPPAPAAQASVKVAARLWTVWTAQPWQFWLVKAHQRVRACCNCWCALQQGCAACTRSQQLHRIVDTVLLPLTVIRQRFSTLPMSKAD